MMMTFSEVVSQVAAARNMTSQSFEEMERYAARSECGRLIANGEAKRLAEILEEAGMTWEEYNDELKSRTTEKWAHFSGLQIHPTDLEIKRAW